MSKDYWKCPIAFRQNCVFYEVHCYECAAFSEDQEEFCYKAINPKDPDLNFNKHPYILEKKKQKQQEKDEVRRAKTLAKKDQAFQKKRQVVRTGYKTEKKLLNKISAKSTLASGRVNHDADGVKEIISDIKLGIEHKTRLNGRHILGPTSEEWTTAQNQGAKVFITTSKEMGSIVTLSLDTFNQLIEIIESLDQDQK